MANLNYTLNGSSGTSVLENTLDFNADTVNITITEGVDDGNEATTYVASFIGDSSFTSGVDDVFNIDIPDGWSVSVDGGSYYGVSTYQLNIYASPSPTGIGTDVMLLTITGKLKSVPCFTAGTMIETADGLRPVESLAEGDMVLTRDHGLQPLRWIGHSHMTEETLVQAPELRPVRIAAGALGDHDELLVSPKHRMLLDDWRAAMLFGEDEVLATAESLINDSTVTRASDVQSVTYVHLLFDKHQIVKANGAWSESFHPNAIVHGEMSEAVRDEVVAIFPELEVDGAGAYGPVARRSLTPSDVVILNG